MKKMLEEKQAWEIFEDCQYHTISCIDLDGLPYAYMTSLVKIGNDLYAHGSLQGKKIDCIKNNPNVFISACKDIMYDKNNMSGYYNSIHIQGKAYLVLDHEEKSKALEKIVRKYANQEVHIKETNHVAVLKIKVEKIWGKSKYD